jgi:predicted CXXCH cytochrome family protein
MSPVEALWYRKEAVRDFHVEKNVETQADEILPSDVISRSCLGCHDGSIADGFPQHEMPQHPEVSLLGGKGEVTPNLNLHLFRFQNDNVETHLPESTSAIYVDETGDVSCVSCHDPHNNELGSFLKVSADKSQICYECHEMSNWEMSSHGNSADPRFAELNDMACSHCHDIHAVPARHQLLKADENTLCFSCHDGMKNSKTEIAADADLKAVFEKTFIHPIQWSSGKPEITSEFGDWSNGIANARSIGCSDCHNPHAASEHVNEPFLDGSQLYVAGVDARGFSKAVADYEYETCYKCHGMNQNTPMGGDVGRLFARSNASYHPVEGMGNNPFVPSLKPEWSEQSMIRCSDCHGNDDPMGAQGPHGSSIPHILKASYAEYPFASLEENQLCFRCHEEQRVVQSNGFKYHQLHISDAGYACSACHDPHGSVEYPGLMNLNQGFIQPLNGVLEVVQTEPGHGYCTMKCHDKAHPSQTY